MDGDLVGVEDNAGCGPGGDEAVAADKVGVEVKAEVDEADSPGTAEKN